jgi:hypothetical protein
MGNSPDTTKVALGDATVQTVMPKQLGARSSWITPQDRGEDLLFPPWRNVRRDPLVACAQAGIAPCSPNDLRRTYAK